MNPKFRWLLHTAVQYNFPELFTFSVGDENFEQVVVCQLQSILRRVESGKCSHEKALSSVNKRFGSFESSISRHSPTVPSMKMAQENSREIPKRSNVDLKMGSQSQARKGSRRPDIQLYVPRARRSCPTDPIDPPDLTKNEDSLTIKTKHTRPIKSSDSTATCGDNVSNLTKSENMTSDFVNSDSNEIMSVESNENLLPVSYKNDERQELGSSLRTDSECGTSSLSLDEALGQTERETSLMPEVITQEDCTTQSSVSENVSADDVLGCGEDSQEYVEATNCESTKNDFKDILYRSEGDTNVLPVDEPYPVEVVSSKTTRLKEAVAEKASVEDIQRLPNPESRIDPVPQNQPEKRALGTTSPTFQIPTADSWDTLFDENGDCVEPSVLKGLSAALGEVKIEKPKIDYLDFQPQDPDLSEESYEHILELYDFPAEFKTPDLMMALSVFKERGFEIVWVDDTHALAIFASPVAAFQALEMQIPFIKIRPVSQATSKSKWIVTKKLDYLLPPKPRPATSASLARRLITGALGMKSQVTREQRESERHKLQVAKENKRQVAKLKQDIWNGTVS